jgi:hypothetical protein
VRPLAVGLGGWIDAGFAATGAVKTWSSIRSDAHRGDRSRAVLLFTDTRSRVSHPQPGVRLPVWPKRYAVRMPEECRDLVSAHRARAESTVARVHEFATDTFERLGIEMLVSGAVLRPITTATPPLRWATTDSI